jgi:hypothetical protein
VFSTRLFDSTSDTTRGEDSVRTVIRSKCELKVRNCEVMALVPSVAPEIRFS